MKIIQIIPFNKEMYSVYEDSEDASKDLYLPIVCLALVEYHDGGREVKALDIDDFGTIDVSEGIGNFKGISEVKKSKSQVRL